VAADARASADPPLHLHETGLFAAGSPAGTGPGVMSFTPQYALWSDGAAKRRWLYLPPGTQIDAANPDAWEFPRGTRLWKEFAHDRAVETRYIERRAMALAMQPMWSRRQRRRARPAASVPVTAPGGRTTSRSPTAPSATSAACGAGSARCNCPGSRHRAAWPPPRGRTSTCVTGARG
jgi:hypothetical protein